MWGPQTPLGVFIQEELQFHNSFHFPKGESLLLHLVVGHLTLFHSVTIIQHQEGQVTRENNNNVFTRKSTSPIIAPLGVYESTVFLHTPIDYILILQHCFY